MKLDIDVFIHVSINNYINMFHGITYGSSSRFILLTWNNSYFYMFPTSSTTEFKIKKYLIIKILVPEVSHEPTTGKNIFHFCYTFHLKSQTIFWRKSHLKKKMKWLFHWLIVKFIFTKNHVLKRQDNKKSFFWKLGCSCLKLCLER